MPVTLPEFEFRTIFAEKRIRRFQQNRLPPRYHLREFRVQTRFSMEIEFVSIQAVSPGQANLGARNPKL